MFQVYKNVYIFIFTFLHPRQVFKVPSHEKNNELDKLPFLNLLLFSRVHCSMNIYCCDVVFIP